MFWDAGSRTDATEFVSAPFAVRTSFFGCPRLRVPVRSDCEDTQFFFRLDACSDGGVYVQHANVAKPWAEVLEREVKTVHNEIPSGELTLDLPLE